MEDLKENSKPLTEAISDRQESVSSMEPLVLSSESRRRDELTDLALELAAQSVGFRSSIPPAFVRALAVLVRSMNCYYSNLIEGHDTHPVDIERALKKDYSTDSRKRNLQLEAEAHVTVQAWIDDGGISGRAHLPVRPAALPRFMQRLKLPTDDWADLKASLRQRQHITDYFGYTPSLMATDVLLV
jgi:hypothetical protein